MANMSGVTTSFILLGVVEMEKFRYLYSMIAIFVYIITMFICCLIVFVVWSELTLHQPMYIFICNLLFNGMFGSSAFLPKLIVDLLSGSRSITFSGCLVQSFFIHSFATVEVFTFTLMAHDRYLAVGQPLRYTTLMTNGKAIRFITVNWATSFLVVVIPVIMTTYVPLCGKSLNSVFCDNMSLIKLACGEALVNNIFGAVEASLIDISCILIIIYYYIRTFITCLRISKEASQKAIQTLVTHLVAFSAFMIACFFVLLRYRINSGSISLSAHVSITSIGLMTPITVNPIIYGIRTEALKVKILQKFQKMKQQDL
ncbi:olfactory receptor 14A2-like [Bufo gargarizans]|uniref:olfactory receptor 14A2-like n=1 Tax=Bufo gargarizans TaxID=30331 RepID=UPI001CF4AA35|nr:olfactory receptor 14A2-like [Bufo gargarizans]